MNNGFVVLAYDPIGQGERREFWNPETKRNEIGGPVTWEHDMRGHLLFLLGENLTEYRIWDGMRAIDYLETRPEVDAKRIGCTGHSGGGTLTLYISSVDERVQCAVMNEGGYGRRWPMKIGPGDEVGTGDAEQHFFPAANLWRSTRTTRAWRLRHGRRCRPSSITRSECDERNRARACGLPAAGRAGRFRHGGGLDPHALTPKLRLRTVDWFCRWFYHRPGPTVEPDFSPEAPESLYCTPNGSIRYSQQGETIFSLILKKGAALPPSRKAPSSRAELDSFRHEIGRRNQGVAPLSCRRRAAGCDGCWKPPRAGVITSRSWSSFPNRGFTFPPGSLCRRRSQRQRPLILYVDEAGKDEEGMEFGLLEQLARKGQCVVAVDVRGIGSTRPPIRIWTRPQQFTNLEECADGDGLLALGNQ